MRGGGEGERQRGRERERGREGERDFFSPALGTLMCVHNLLYVFIRGAHVFLF